jgi:hypothetical protein
LPTIWDSINGGNLDGFVKIPSAARLASGDFFEVILSRTFYEIIDLRKRGQSNLDELVKSQKIPFPVMPVKTGVQSFQ